RSVYSSPLAAFGVALDFAGETTMDPSKRTLLRVSIDAADDTKKSIDNLMGTKPELRFQFIQDNAAFANDDLLDV
ncbi:MAG: hypothetical protein AAFO98_06510, partial [Pseudomonadota bacterium]